MSDGSAEERPANQTMNQNEKVIEMPLTEKIIACTACGREILVKKSVVMAFCGDCSKDQGKKR